MTKVEVGDAEITESLITAMDIKIEEIVKLLPQAFIKPINLGQKIIATVRPGCRKPRCMGQYSGCFGGTPYEIDERL
jgi:hypothetical protein